MEFTLSEQFNARPESVFNAWLDSGSHSEMTGGAAEISPTEGSKFIAWDGYIEGAILKLVPNKKIVCSWRTSDFDEGQGDSVVEITLERTGDKTNFILQHKELTEADHHYIEGWQEHYFRPMREYFKSS